MFHKYTGNEQFDLQINRFIRDFESDPTVQEDMKKIVPQLTDLNHWFEGWSKLAALRELQGDYLIASAYYKAADFYLLPNDPYKKAMCDGFRRNFYKGYRDFDLERYDIPYEAHYLPAVKICMPNATKDLVVFGGYDSFMEEIIPMMRFLKDAGHNIIVFDGPGQGSALQSGLKFIMNWEKPVAQVLDYFHLHHVSLMGISWGGYFAMRAAAYEKRIDKVIAFDIFYSALDALFHRMSLLRASALRLMIASRQRHLINLIIKRLAMNDIDLYWKIHKGYELTGETSPLALINNFKRHTMKGLGALINQEVLLLAGEDDQYVPLKRLKQIEKELCNAASVTSKVFTKASGGAEHCQAGNPELAFAEICRFLTADEDE